MKILVIGSDSKRTALKVFILTVYFLSCFCFLAFASRNEPCIAQITTKVLSSNKHTEQVKISPDETEMVSFVDVEIEIISVDSVPACGFRVGQKIKTAVVRDDIYAKAKKGNRVKEDAVIKPGTVLKGSMDYIADENGEIGYFFESISEVVNQ